MGRDLVSTFPSVGYLPLSMPILPQNRRNLTRVAVPSVTRCTSRWPPARIGCLACDLTHPLHKSNPRSGERRFLHIPMLLVGAS